jgi:hypothetical protein
MNRRPDPSSSASLLARIFEPLYSKPCWLAQRGFASFLTFEFGEPHLEVHPVRNVTAHPDVLAPTLAVRWPRRLVYVRGDWHLWIYCCAWSIDRKGTHLAQSESSDEQIDRAMHMINGQALTRIEVNPQDARSRFTFDLGAILTTWPDPAAHAPVDEDESERAANHRDEQWTLYEPSGYVLTVRADGRYQHGPGNQSPDATPWTSLSLHSFSSS